MTQHEKELKQIKQAADYFHPKGAFIAGGALTSAFTKQPINDVDFYFKTREDFINAVAQAYGENYWCVAATDRAVTFINRDCVIQLMLFEFFPTAESIFDAFDYTVCMAAYDLDKEEFILHKDFLKHASQRYLSFHSGTRYPYGSLMRVLKYQSRGYTIGKGDLLRIALCCSQVEVNSWDDLAKAVGGQYGDSVDIESDVPFSMEEAVKIFAQKDEITTTKSEEMPGNAFELLKKIGIDHNFTEEDLEW